MRKYKFRCWYRNKMRYDITGFEFYGEGNLSGVFIDGDFADEIELMQFTGLYDKNRKEIYEGDKVYIIPEDNYGEIKWDSDMARFVVIYDDLITDFDNWYGYDLEVVGTIYD